PRFRSSASVSAQRPAFATGVPPDICAFHRYTRNSSLPCRTQVMPVSTARPQLSCRFSRQTRHTAYELFTPNNSGQRSHPTYYRGCWHVVSRCFFSRYRQYHPSSLAKEVYNPKAVIPHAASLHQACAHCAIFPTAASRRSLGRVSVPVWPVTLSGRLPVDALASHYLTNKLIGREPIPNPYIFPTSNHAILVRIQHSTPFAALSPASGAGCARVTHPFATDPQEQAPASPFDLHVLSTPPAFILRQDQTLRKRKKPRQPEKGRRSEFELTKEMNQTDFI